MSDTQPREPAQPVHEETISINQFSADRIGLVPGSTSIKVDRYAIVCMPFRMSQSGAVLLASFSPQELALFQRYANSLASLTLSIQPADSAQPLKLFARCTVNSVTPMRGRESLGLISIAWKPCPVDLKSILDDYLLTLERLKVEYEDYRGKSIKLDPDSSARLGYNNYAALVHGGGQVKVAAFSLASDRLDFLVPKGGPELEPKAEATVKLYFRSYQFSVAGSFADAQKLPNGAQKASLSLRFSPELVYIIERYRFHEQFGAQRAQ